MQEEEVAEEEVRESALRMKERVGELLSVKPLEPPLEAVSVVRLARGLALSPGFQIGRGAAALCCLTAPAAVSEPRLGWLRAVVRHRAARSRRPAKEAVGLDRALTGRRIGQPGVSPRVMCVSANDLWAWRLTARTLAVVSRFPQSVAASLADV